jgi:hypothetical protein
MFRRTRRRGGLIDMRRETYKNADYPNAKPSWMKLKIKKIPETPEERISRITKELNYKNMVNKNNQNDEKRQCKDCEFNDPNLCGYVKISTKEGRTYYDEMVHNCKDFVRNNCV